MNTLELIDKLASIFVEIVFPVLALWLCYYVRKWLRGTLPVPPHIHEVSLKEPPGTGSSMPTPE